MGIKLPGGPKPSTPAAGGTGASSELWDEVSDEVERRSVMWVIYGPTGTGRTRLGLTAPGPIALAHTAEKIDGIVQQAKHGTIPNVPPQVIRVNNFGVAASGS